MENTTYLTIALVTRSKDGYSETFIESHRTLLPYNVLFVYGTHFPLYKLDGRPIKGGNHSLGNLYERLLRKFGKLPSDYFQKKALQKYFADHKVKAVLAEYGTTGVLVMDVCEKMGIPLIVHFYGFDAYRHELLARMREQYRELFRKSAAIVAVSLDMLKKLESLGAPAEKLHYNPCGVDVNLFTRTVPSKNPLVFLSAGRFVEKKAPYLTLLAFQKVLEQVESSSLVMVGDGELLDVCKNISRSLKLDDHVQFIGACDHLKLAQLMQSARGFVQHSIVPSSGDSEGTPVAILEACASGLPVISTRHGGIPEVIENNKNGFLVEEGDIEKMAEYMIWIAKNPEKADEIGNHARQNMEENFNMQLRIANLTKIIQNAIEEYSR